MGDWSTLHDRIAEIDVLDLIGSDTLLRHVASTNGGEYAGPCPFCGGDDRFRVQPFRSGGGRWWCRRCSEDGRWRDGIAYLRRRDDLSFTQACAALGIRTRNGEFERSTQTGAAIERPKPPALPSVGWRQSAARVSWACQRSLWSRDGARARAWLAGRGLTAETIRRWRIGFNARDRELHGLWVRRGIVIPWLLDGEVIHLKVRRAADDPRYVAVKGGRPILFGADTLSGRPAAVLCEGELDAIVLYQVAGDLVGVATLGSCHACPGSLARQVLTAVPHLLVAYDADEPGRAGASRLVSLIGRASPLDLTAVPLPVAPSTAPKDLTDLYLAGADLRAWLETRLTNPPTGRDCLL